MRQLQAIAAPYPHLHFYPTGGITEKNLQAGKVSAQRVLNHVLLCQAYLQIKQAQPLVGRCCLGCFVFQVIAVGGSWMLPRADTLSLLQTTSHWLAPRMQWPLEIWSCSRPSRTALCRRGTLGVWSSRSEAEVSGSL